MTRHLIFNLVEGKYTLEENDSTVFSIDERDLKFVSLDFYNGMYKNKNCAAAISIANKTTDKTGKYIYLWLKEITEAIALEFADEINEDAVETEVVEAEETNTKIIRLYELAVCAGSGDYSSMDITYEDYSTDNLRADYAVRVSGESMEPTIKNRSILLIQETQEIRNDDIGIFVVDGYLMCKRYKEIDGTAYLCPDNTSGEFKEIEYTEDRDIRFQGKVVGIVPCT